MTQPGILPGDPADKHQITVDTQDFTSIRPGLTEWLSSQLGANSVELTVDESGLGNGMSSVTVICTATTAPSRWYFDSHPILQMCRSSPATTSICSTT